MDWQRPRDCAFCRKRSTTLQDCGGCGTVSYCNRDCQRGDWKNHKTICANMAAKRPTKAKIGTGHHQEGAICAIPLSMLIPHDIRYKCDHLDKEDEKKKQGKDVFGGLAQEDEIGWEEQSAALRLQKLCQHVQNIGSSEFDFYSALKRVMEKRNRSNRITDKTMSMKQRRRAHECNEVLAVCKSLGLSDKEAKGALEVVDRWRKVPNWYEEI
jgi:hypothetical protein